MSWIISVKVMDIKHKYDPFFMYSECLLDYSITRYDITTDLAVILTLYLPRSASWLTSVTSMLPVFTTSAWENLYCD